MSFLIVFILAGCWGVASKWLFYKKGWNFHFPSAPADSFFGKDGWKNKYAWHYVNSQGRKIKAGLVAAPDSWYYRWNHLKYKERFPGSATIFVTFTDVHHTAQWILTRLIFADLTIRLWSSFWQPFAAYTLVWWIGFNLTFLSRKK